ncbi:MAG TPA: NAD(P)H-dependent oxidoreductase, partial [Bacteroidales bacterium]|nr:NAD(P)H-dependent oxidoreductase [Bacteroidales bacterium]
MKAVAFNGSPRKGGNTEILLREVLNVLDQKGFETELVQVGGKKVKGCIACMKCRQK